MVKITFGAQVTIGAAVLSTMGCTLITKLAIINPGGLASEGANAFGFTTSFADVDKEKLNTQIHVDTDSSFFVCDNSTTGYICNDIWKFVPGSI